MITEVLHALPGTRKHHPQSVPEVVRLERAYARGANADHFTRTSWQGIFYVLWREGYWDSAVVFAESYMPGLVFNEIQVAEEVN